MKTKIAKPFIVAAILALFSAARAYAWLPADTPPGICDYINSQQVRCLRDDNSVWDCYALNGSTGGYLCIRVRA